MSRSDADRADGRSTALLALLTVPIAFTAVELRGEVRPWPSLNDVGLHEALVRSAARAISAGRNPLVSWFPYLNLGSPQLHHYQSLAHVAAATAGQVFNPDSVVRWSLYLLLVTWPISLYWGARLLGLTRLAAVAAAGLAPLIVSNTNYGFEWGSYIWRGLGLWAQAWGMWLLPLAVGFGAKFLEERRHRIAAPLCLGACIACHLPTGYLAAAIIGAMAFQRRRGIVVRLGRAVWLGAAGVLVWAPFLLPTILDHRWALYGKLPGSPTYFFDSYGAGTITRWFVTGRLFDDGRLPVLTALVLVGFVRALIRWSDPLHRRILIVFMVSMLLFWGRRTLGPLADLLPGGQDVFFPRFLAGVHLGGLLLAGVGVAWIITAVSTTPIRRLANERVAMSAGIVLVTALTIPAFVERHDFAAGGRGFQALQAAADRTRQRDVTTLLAEVRRRADGRVYAGGSSNWGHDNRIGYVQVYAEALNTDTDAVGFYLRVVSLGATFDTYLDDSRAASLETLGVRYLLLPPGYQPPAGSTLLARSGSDSLYQMTGTGYVSVEDTAGVVRTTNALVGAAVGSQVADPHDRWAALRLPDGPVATPSSTLTPTPSTPPGAVISQSNDPDAGVFIAAVHADRVASLVLRSSFHPGWQVFVDGRRVPVFAVAPGYVAANIAPGSHIVTFRFALHQSALWILVSLLTAGALIADVIRARRPGRAKRVPSFRPTDQPVLAASPSD